MAIISLHLSQTINLEETLLHFNVNMAAPIFILFLNSLQYGLSLKYLFSFHRS